jgi:hypothetical protein
MSLHANLRAQQRYNISLSRYDINVIATKINSGNALFVRDEGENQIYYVKHQNKAMKVVYNIKTKGIPTVLPFETDEYNRLIELNKHNKNINKPFVKEIEPIAGFRTFLINDVTYVLRSKVIHQFILTSIITARILKTEDYLTIHTKDILPLCFPGASVSFVRVDSLKLLLPDLTVFAKSKISNSNNIYYQETIDNINKIIGPNIKGKKIMQEKIITYSAPNYETESNILYLLKKQSEVLNTAIQEIEEKERLKIKLQQEQEKNKQLEDTNKKQNGLLMDIFNSLKRHFN